jgi:tripartite-type tricarboxylate transporter receptor subunit TctC
MKLLAFDRLLSIWRGFSNPPTTKDTEVERIAILKQTAATRRAEHARNQEQAGVANDAARSHSLSASLKRVKAAESEHIRALQTWENKNSRQKCQR